MIIIDLIMARMALDREHTSAKAADPAEQTQGKNLPIVACFAGIARPQHNTRLSVADYRLSST